MTTEIQQSLADLLHSMGAPFLFIGSGISRRFVGADNWDDLLRRFAAKTPRDYDYYKTSAGGDLTRTASELAPAFHETWWSSDEFAESREQWRGKMKDKSSALKVEISNYLSSLTESLPSAGIEADEINLLRKAVVDGIITTNYDTILENLFPDFRPFIGQDELVFSNSQGVGEIYKIHGCCTRPDSLVLTAEDYATFQGRNAYLAAKLMTTFVEHPVIFLGYSLGDPNITAILHSIVNCLTEEKANALRDRLIFVQWDAEAQPTMAHYTITVDGFNIPLIRLVVPDFVGVFTALTTLKRVFPARLLRTLKEQVYELVETNDPAGRLYVTDIEDSLAEQVDVVFGIGIKEQLGSQGYLGVDRWALADDVLRGGSMNPRRIIQEVLPAIVRRGAYVPVFKYLRQSGALDDEGQILAGLELHERVTALATQQHGGVPAGDWQRNRAHLVLAGIRGIKELEEAQGTEGVLGYAACLPVESIDLHYLRNFLISNVDLKVQASTYYMKLICTYDWIAYGLNRLPSPE